MFCSYKNNTTFVENKREITMTHEERMKDIYNRLGVSAEDLKRIREEEELWWEEEKKRIAQMPNYLEEVQKAKQNLINDHLSGGRS